jgi:homoserine O-acetyltransferase
MSRFASTTVHNTSAQVRVSSTLRRSRGRRTSRPTSTQSDTPLVTHGRWNTPRLTLESGAVLYDVPQQWTLVGTPNAAGDNVVLVTHALTGTSKVHEWWSNIVGPGLAIDTTRYAVLCANVLGGCDGSAGPRTDSDDGFPAITTRDQAQQLWHLLDAFGVHSPALIVGGSLGGMVALEVAALRPDRVREVVVLAAPAVQTALGAGWHALMRTAVSLGGARDGLALARMVGMLSYRSAEGFEARFGEQAIATERPSIAKWLEHHGERLVERFDARSYVTLIDAMDRHDVGRGRGGVQQALHTIADKVTGVGIPGDLLYPAEAVRQWTAKVGARYAEVSSQHGHDAFLLETQQVATILREAIARSEAALAPVATSVRTHESAAHSALAPLRVALAGCGTVGDALVALFANRAAAGWRPVHLSAVLVRDLDRERRGLAHATTVGIVEPNALTRDRNALLHDNPDVLIEALGGVEPARTLVEAALKRGIRVVTANKALIAAHGPELLSLARAHHTTLDFEGAVGASIPVVRSVRSVWASRDICAIEGVLNGTTNVILDEIANGVAFATALANAQANGFAEADPSRDLDGRDAEDKLRVLAWLAFGIAPDAIQVTRRGLDAATVRWAAWLARRGEKVRLIAELRREGHAVQATIRPQRVDGEGAWAQVKGAQNRIVIRTSAQETLVLNGLGAGGHATALALLGDLLSPASDAVA